GERSDRRHRSRRVHGRRDVAHALLVDVAEGKFLAPRPLARALPLVLGAEPPALLLARGARVGPRNARARHAAGLVRILVPIDAEGADALLVEDRLREVAVRIGALAAEL